MKNFFLILDHLIFVSAVFFVWKKGSLSIIYVPLLYFCYRILEESKYVVLMQLMLALLLLYYIFFNLPFVKRNFLSIILILYHFILLPTIENFYENKWILISMSWIFLIVPLAPEILSRYSKERITRELVFCAFLILVLFNLNSLLSTALGYYPESHYGFTSGVSFGNINIPVYGVFPLAIYLVFREGVKRKKILYLGISIASVFLVMLILRRTTMALSLLAILFVMIELFTVKQMKQFFLYGILISGIGVFVALKTGFVDQLAERVAARRLAERELSEEGRFIEFGLMYKDLFVYFEYDPVFGYGLFSSSGNYGKGIFGSRPLHSDITYHLHSSGLVGLLLYVSTMAFAFYQVWIRIRTREEKLQFCFLSIYFVVHFILGTSKNLMAPVLLFLMLNLPFAKVKKNNLSIDKIKMRKISEIELTQKK